MLQFRGVCDCGWTGEWCADLVAALDASSVHDELCSDELTIETGARTRPATITLRGP